MIWDWPIPGIGITGVNAYNFFDKLPTSFKNEDYIQSGNSFSENYQSFLSLLDPIHFPLTQPLEEGLQIFESEKNADGTIPRYFTKVDTQGINVLKPAYNITDYPYTWINKNVASGAAPLNLKSSSGEITTKSGISIDT